MKKYLPLISIVILGIFLRFWQLGVVPVGVTHDELGYIYNSYSIATTGKNVFGEFLPFLTWVNKGGWPFLPVPIYFSVPFFWLFGLSAMVGRLPSAFLGVVDILLLYLLVKQVFKNKELALLSAFFLAISPWHLHFSRSAYDFNFAFFFYLLGTVTFIYEIKNKRLPLFSVLSFLIAIFSYRGMNIIFLPLTTMLIWYATAVLKITKKQLIVFLLGILILLSSLALTIAINGKAYIAEAFSVSDTKMQEEIDTFIREAQGPLVIRRFFLNKPMYVVNKLRENYVKAYSPEFLFLYTEPSGIYSIWSRGRIYFIDIVFIFLGVAYLYKIDKKGAFFMTSMIFIGGLPGMLGGMPYSARNFFLSAILPVFSSAGILFLIYNPLLRKLKIVVIAIVVLIYAYLLGSYLFDYYGRYALYGAESWAKSLKDVSFMIMEKKHKYDKVVVETASFGDLLQYAFYSKIDPLEIQKAWLQSEDAKDKFSIGNIDFVTGCIGEKEGKLPWVNNSYSSLYIARGNCNKTATPSGFIKEYHGNIVWKIYENRY